jgi:glucokinase
MLLVGDIGGTHSRLALVAAGSSGEPIAEQVFPSQRYSALEHVIDDFLGRRGPAIEHAVFAVAGPVVGGRADLTNLGWTVDQNRLREAVSARSVCVLNDLQALAYAVPQLGPDALRTLQPGVPDPAGTIAVVAPGTGLGEAFLVRETIRYRAHPSEGGHSDFGPIDALQLELLRWLQPRFEHVSYERVCSGRGIPLLYAFLEQRGEAPAEQWLIAQLAAVEDPTPVIVEAALSETARSGLCAATLELFAAILAAEAGNTALRFLATGGVYLAGAMVQRVLPVLEKPGFLAAFRCKGRLTDLLERVPLHVVVNPNIALMGTIQYALAEARAAG